jgi:hypothetical protein
LRWWKWLLLRCTIWTKLHLKISNLTLNFSEFSATRLETSWLAAQRPRDVQRNQDYCWIQSVK